VRLGLAPALGLASVGLAPPLGLASVASMASVALLAPLVTKRRCFCNARLCGRAFFFAGAESGNCSTLQRGRRARLCVPSDRNSRKSPQPDTRAGKAEASHHFEPGGRIRKIESPQNLPLLTPCRAPSKYSAQPLDLQASGSIPPKLIRSACLLHFPPEGVILPFAARKGCRATACRTSDRPQGG
jgi:hypothetical protein